MGDGNGNIITWEATDKEKAAAAEEAAKLAAKVPPLPLAEEAKEDTNKLDKPESTTRVDDATPRSTTTTEGNDTARSDGPPPQKTLEVEELHRNTNNSVNTPELSSASIDSPPGHKQETPSTTPRRRNPRGGQNQGQASTNEYGLPLGPAAGLGPQEAAADPDQGMFSVRGTRSFKITRHRDSVTCFPSGCMGVQDKEKEPGSVSTSENVPVNPATVPVNPANVPAAGLTQNSNLGLGRPNSAVRNPLTGEGYEEDDKKQMHGRKKDGNPVLGSGYEAPQNFRHQKIPPGGYSKGLW